MNILLGVTSLSRMNGGVSTHMVELGSRLKSMGHNVYFVSSGGEYIEDLKKVGIEHFELPFLNIQKNPVKILNLLLQLLNICKEKKIDIIHTHGQSLILFAQIIKKIKKIPFLWTNHIDKIPQPQLFQKLYNFSCFPIISVSTDLKNYLLNNFQIKNEDITVINNGVSLDSYTHVSQERIAQIRKSFGLNDNDYVITLPGRLTSGKGHGFLIDAIVQLHKNYPAYNFVMLVAGNATSDDEKQYLNDILSEAEKKQVNLKYLGFQNMRELLSVTDLMCLPSIFEGFPIVCIEAFLMKVPVVRSDTPGATDVKDLCKIFPKRDVPALIDCISYILDNPASTKEITDIAYQTANKNFSVEAMTNQTLNLYKKIIDKK